MKTIIVSHKGRREINQDYVLTQKINDDCHLHLIADGMGGYDRGEVASKIIAENIRTFLLTVKTFEILDIQRAINKANLVIRQATKNSDSKMGATIGGLILSHNSTIGFWVGDVKVFKYQKNKILFESQSHTLMNELIRNGSMVDAEAVKKYKHVVTRAVYGDVKKSQVDIQDLGPLNEDELLLICSDGVHEILDGLQIQHMINASEKVENAIAQIEQRLMHEANDNFSFIFCFK